MTRYLIISKETGTSWQCPAGGEQEYFLLIGNLTGLYWAAAKALLDCGRTLECAVYRFRAEANR